MRQVGIDLGASTIKIVVMQNGMLETKWCEPHYGSVRDVLALGLQECNLTEGAAILGITGSNQSLLRPVTAPCMVDEIPAIMEGTRSLVPDAGCIMEIGSQSSRFLTDLQAKTPRFSVSGHCAGGTGSFFEDQMTRVGLPLEQYSEVVDRAERIPRLSARCAVFAKTDIIHRQQEGVSTPDILLGLCYAMIRNYKAVIIKDLPVRKPVVLAGGVACNRGAVRAVRDIFSLEDKELIIPPEFRYPGAIGAALLAGEPVDLNQLAESLASLPAPAPDPLPPLSLPNDLVLQDPVLSERRPSDRCILGIDIGSTSTDLVLIEEDGTILDFQYLRTAGDPEQAVRTGLNELRKKYGPLTFGAVGVTGSGRTRIGKQIGADRIVDEITAQAKGATTFFPNADTVFEIGGQDSKYISLKDGHVVDFMMNKICAAGTGSFVEEQATRMKIPIREFGPLALTSRHPVDLGERCTVFMETAITSFESNGTPPEDIAAGLCCSIVRNYLHRVVGNKPVGEEIVLQGGVNYNPGIVAAFRQEYGDRVHVSPVFGISGALGAAKLALEAHPEGISSFHGFQTAEEQVPEVRSQEVEENIRLYHRQNEYLMGDYDGSIDPNAKTVGIPYVLVIHRMFPMVYGFFHSLGYNVILSNPTDEETIRLAQGAARGETCYPVKLIYGHMLQLLSQNVDYIFLPRVHTMNHEGAEVTRSYGCVYMQSAPTNVARALHLEEKGVQMLSPVLDLEIGPTAMASCMIELGQSLGHPKPLVMKALAIGAQGFTGYGKKMEALGREILGSIRPDEKVLVLITRPYGMNDPILNMGIPELLLERGYKIITNEHLPGHQVAIGEQYPNMYWPFGQHILGGVSLIAQHPNLFGIYLTNHGCGPDSILNHLVEEQMNGKPYLSIEVDEHFSKVGVITRIEAFLNSLESVSPDPVPDLTWLRAPSSKEPSMPAALIQSVAKKLPPVRLARKIRNSRTKEEPGANTKIDPSLPLYFPELGPYTPYLKEYLSQTQKTEIHTVALTREAFRDGRAVARSKEYLPFAALAGMAFSLKKTISGPAQFLIPSTTGAEIEGEYGLAVRSAWKKQSEENVQIISPILDLIPIRAEDPQSLFRALVTGDFRLLPEAKHIDFPEDHIPSWEELEQIAKKIGSKAKTGSYIFAVGEPYCLYALNEGVLQDLGQAGYRIRYAPFSEYLLFLWSEIPENQKQATLLSHFQAHLETLHTLLQNASPFAPSLKALKIEADKALPSFHGGNGRYRWAKTILCGPDTSAVLEVAPRYENTAMALEMRGLSDACPVPLYALDFDGDWDETAWSRLRSFLHYC